MYEFPQGSWRVKSYHAKHNHELGKTLHGHSFAGRPTEKEKEIIKDMTLAQCTPKQIAGRIKSENPYNTTSKQQFYNYRRRLSVDAMGTRTAVTYFLTESRNRNYFVRYRTVGNTITDIIWAHPDSLGLLKAFPYVLVMDCTYNTGLAQMVKL